MATGDKFLVSGFTSGATWSNNFKKTEQDLIDLKLSNGLTLRTSLASAKECGAKAKDHPVLAVCSKAVVPFTNRYIVEEIWSLSDVVDDYKEATQRLFQSAQAAYERYTKLSEIERQVWSLTFKGTTLGCISVASMVSGACIMSTGNPLGAVLMLSSFLSGAEAYSTLKTAKVKYDALTDEIVRMNSHLNVYRATLSLIGVPEKFLHLRNATPKYESSCQVLRCIFQRKSPDMSVNLDDFAYNYA